LGLSLTPLNYWDNLEPENQKLYNSQFPQKDTPEGYEIFHKELKDYLKEYRKVLHIKYSKVTITKHLCVLQDFIEYVTFHQECTNLGQVTKAMTASGLAKYINNQGDDFYTSTTVKNIVTAFFQFIYDNHGIRNPKLIP
jgi:hypothetical protein